MPITYDNVTNPRYADKDGHSINVEVVFQGLPELPGNGSVNGQVITFCAMPTDSMDYGREIYARALRGEFGPIAPYVKQ